VRQHEKAFCFSLQLSDFFFYMCLNSVCFQAYQACGREEECIETYKIIEKTHPLPAIRRQAAELRYIMEAPKLELSPDEKVSIPVLNDLEPAGRGRSVAVRPAPGAKQQKPKTWDEEFWESYQAPVYLKNFYVWWAAAILAAGMAWWSSTARF
jgi:hypothetical protein